MIGAGTREAGGTQIRALPGDTAVAAAAEAVVAMEAVGVAVVAAEAAAAAVAAGAAVAAVAAVAVEAAVAAAGAVVAVAAAVAVGIRPGNRREDVLGSAAVCQKTLLWFVCMALMLSLKALPFQLDLVCMCRRHHDPLASWQKEQRGEVSCKHVIGFQYSYV